MRILKISRRILVALTAVIWLAFLFCLPAQSEHLVYHEIQIDSKGHILPWYSADPGTAYDHVLRKLWDFWKNMRTCPNGVKYYLQHQVWSNPVEDSRGLGGDQLAMALSSWNLLHAYTGDRSIVENMRYIADYYLAHGLSRPDAKWPNLLYPYNTDLHSGIYDGDMRAGKGYLQPDKAGAFAIELVVLFEITGESRYLKAAIDIANTLADKVTPGDSEHSPWPYRVHTQTGEVSLPYTANWTGTLRLFDELIRLNQGNVAAYSRAYSLASAWLQKYPLKTNKWGPFFEDVPQWSDTEINADTMAWYILEHPGWTADWKQAARTILEWSSSTFANKTWEKYGVTAINEQTVYLVPGNSHTSRHASVQLIYSEKTGDLSKKDSAIRQLNWATYMVGDAGNNCYALDNVWLTDGYGDYVRHYLRAMAAAPELAPPKQNHLLKTTSVIKSISYTPTSVSYSTFDVASRELLRVSFAPNSVKADGKSLHRHENISDLETQQGFTFEAVGDTSGVLRVRHDSASRVDISKEPVSLLPIAQGQEITVQQGTETSFRLLAANIRSLPQNLKYTLYGPFHGKLSGTAPQLSYSPEPDFLGSDTLTFQVIAGERESNIALVKLIVVRSNLARLPEAQPFTTENPKSGAEGHFPLPALTDGVVSASVMASVDRAASREVAIGVTWPSPRRVQQIVLRQGVVNRMGHGYFNRGMRLQVLTEGTNWKDADQVRIIPLPYTFNAAASLEDFTFTLPQPVQVQGARIIGIVGGQGASHYLSVRELEVYSGPPSPKPPRIEYETENQVVAVGGTTNFGVRLSGTGHVVCRWQRSQDEGKTWQDIPHTNSNYLSVKAISITEFNGNLFRCVVSNGVSPDTISKPLSLKVVPADGNVYQSSRNPVN